MKKSALPSSVDSGPAEARQVQYWFGGTDERPLSATSSHPARSCRLAIADMTRRGSNALKKRSNPRRPAQVLGARSQTSMLKAGTCDGRAGDREKDGIERLHGHTRGRQRAAQDDDAHQSADPATRRSVHIALRLLDEYASCPLRRPVTVRYGWANLLWLLEQYGWTCRASPWSWPRSGSA